MKKFMGMILVSLGVSLSASAVVLSPDGGEYWPDVATDASIYVSSEGGTFTLYINGEVSFANRWLSPFTGNSYFYIGGQRVDFVFNQPGPATSYTIYYGMGTSPDPNNDADPGNDLPFWSALLPAKGSRIYYAGDGFGLIRLEGGAISETSTNGAQHVEAWIESTDLVAARVGEHSRGITWHCLLYDQDGEPYRDRAGEVLVFPVVPEWRKFPEAY